MDLNLLSRSYTVTRLDKADVNICFELMRKNTIFYKHHPPFVTKESILEDMKALPPKKVMRISIMLASLRIKHL